MAQKVAKLAIDRDPDFMYYIQDGDVWRIPRQQPGENQGRKQKVARAGVEMDADFVYYLDREGDIARARRVLGGEKKPKKNTPPSRKPRAKKKA